jgi:hypothetical protein
MYAKSGAKGIAHIKCWFTEAREGDTFICANNATYNLLHLIRTEKSAMNYQLLPLVQLVLCKSDITFHVVIQFMQQTVFCTNPEM